MHAIPWCEGCIASAPGGSVDKWKENPGCMQSTSAHLYICIHMSVCLSFCMRVCMHGCPVRAIARLPVTGIFVFDFAKELAGLFT